MPTSRCLTRTRRRLKYAAGDTFIAAPILALRRRPRPPPIRAQHTAALGHLRPTGLASESRSIAARALPPLLGIYAQPGRPGNASQSPPDAQP